MEQRDFETTRIRRLTTIRRLMRKQGRTFELQKEFKRGGRVTSLSVILLGDLAQEFEPILAEFLKKAE